MSRAKWILPIIVISQFCCTSLWFAGNSVMTDLALAFDLSNNALGHLTSAVQFGFISGTLVFALFTIADRFSPSKVFFTCAILGALFNLGITLENNTFTGLLAFRFVTGFFLAGIYPVGMKIASDHFQKGLGKSLGFLVGALVLGTAFPHFLKAMSSGFPWRSVLLFTSGLATIGGLLMFFFVPDGKHRKSSQKPDFTAFFKVFENKKFRSAAFGYFGHMWELYAFWAFVPIMLANYSTIHSHPEMDIPLLSFFIIALGGVACVVGGYLSEYFGTEKIAFIALKLSCICCLVSPLIFTQTSPTLLIGFLIFWGLVVIADSPLFSTLVAQNAIPESKGTALTIVNCIGFFITIFSIQLLSYLQVTLDVRYVYMVLAIGPVFGLVALYRG